MTFGGTTDQALRRLPVLAAMLLLCASAQALELAEVMGLLAQRRHAEAGFTEERFVSGFNEPLRSSGTLSFSAPDNFARRTLQPRPEAMVVEGQRVTLERAGRVRRVGLDDIPELAALVAAVRGTLTGNAAALRQYFEPAVSGSTASWSIRLKPLDERLLDAVRQLRIDGEGTEVRQVEIVLADGDRSVMHIEPMRAGPAGSASASRNP